MDRSALVLLGLSLLPDRIDQLPYYKDHTADPHWQTDLLLVTGACGIELRREQREKGARKSPPTGKRFGTSPATITS